MFWDQYKALCAEVGKSPTAVGREIGVSADAVHKWRNGATPKSSILADAAKYFDCSPGYLLGYIDVRNPSLETPVLPKKEGAPSEEGARIWDELSERQRHLVSLIADLPEDRQAEVIRYVDFVRSQREQ